MIEGYVHVSQQTKNVNLGPKPGMESSFSLKSIRTNNLGMGVENESGFNSLWIGKGFSKIIGKVNKKK